MSKNKEFSVKYINQLQYPDMPYPTGCDPEGEAREEGIYEEEGRKGKVEVKAGYIALCKPEVLAKEIDNRNPGLYLFHRA